LTSCPFSRRCRVFLRQVEKIREMPFAFPRPSGLKKRAIYPSRNLTSVGLEAVFQTAPDASLPRCAYQKTFAAIFLSVFEPRREVREAELAGSL